MSARTSAISSEEKDNRGFHPDESQFTQNEDVHVEVVEDFRKPPIEPAQSEDKQKLSFGFGIEENQLVSVDSSLEQQLSKSEASAETKSLERAIDVDKPSMKSTTSDSSTETKSLEETADIGQPPTKSTEMDPSTGAKSLEKTTDVGQKSTKTDPSTGAKSLEKTTDVGKKSTKTDPSTGAKSLERTTDVGKPSTKSTISDTSTGAKSLEKTADVGQPSVKSTTSVQISPSQVPSSDKGLQNVTENIQLIYEGLKSMKISAKENPGSDSAKKERKLPLTPRARSTPVKPLTSPPLTRSRSRDLRKLPSTPSSPKRSGDRKNGDSDSGETKVARGRQRVKKN